MKRNTMAQWMHLHRNNSFVNRTRVCEKSGGGLLDVSGSYGRQAGKLAVRQ